MLISRHLIQLAPAPEINGDQLYACSECNRKGGGGVELIAVSDRNVSTGHKRSVGLFKVNMQRGGEASGSSSW